MKTTVLTMVAIAGLAGSALANTTPQVLPFSQDWTNIGLITVSDDWSGVPGIEGYRGDDAVAGSAVDPQTILVDYNTVIDVNANNLNPTTFTTGGVAEFHIADPVVGLQGSGTGDFPNLVIFVNTTGYQNIQVLANLRDIDAATTDNAIQQINFQYRVGNAGAWTNIAGGYTADATTGPGIATLVTPVNLTLPAAANNVPEVQIRVMTTNAVGNDEWVGIDDIGVRGETLPVATESTTWSAIKSGPNQ